MVTIYRDGEWLNSQSYGKWISMKPLPPGDLVNPVHAAIGLLKSNHAHERQKLDGPIDDVQIYRRALDAQAVRSLFQDPGAVWEGK